jgi:putative endonuclease
MVMGNHNQNIGAWGERLATNYLNRNGYSILDRNYHTRAGELDLVALEYVNGEPCLVFVEVKTRTSLNFGHPEEAVTLKKWLRIMEAVDDYLENHQEYEYDWRIDVIAIQSSSTTSEVELRHFENIILPYDESY